MKLLIQLLTLTLSATAFGASSTIYCKVNGKITNAYSEDGRYDCAGALMEGTACYTGARKAIISDINSNAFNWDEEWLEGANFNGPSAISYYFVDGPNELRDKIVMDRCTDDFFKKD
jgi:hypothetical protein